MASTKAQVCRHVAIAEIIAMALDPEDSYSVRPGVTVAGIVKAIEDMRALGRTERWQASLTRWQEMVKECNEISPLSPEWARHMNWAILQGNVYACSGAL